MKRFFTIVALALCANFVTAQVTVTFNVDMNGYTASENFDVYISGSIFGWTEPGTDDLYKLTDGDGDGIYTIEATGVAAGEVEFKYFAGETGTIDWDSGEWPGDPNRTLTVATTDLVTANIWSDITDTPTGVSEISNSTVNIYPNPSTGLFQLSTTATYKVVNVIGKTVAEGTGTSINLTGFNSGLYIVTGKSSEGSFTQKLIIK